MLEGNKRITIYPTPHVELRISASDTMLRDFKKCEHDLISETCSRECTGCSWQNVRICGVKLCTLDGISRFVSGE